MKLTEHFLIKIIFQVMTGFRTQSLICPNTLKIQDIYNKSKFNHRKVKRLVILHVFQK